MLSAVDRAKFRVKIKSLADEARTIRAEEKRAKTEFDRNTLYLHRIGIVRKEQRATLLAYAMARGVPYKVAEPKTRKIIDFKRVRGILNSLAGIEMTQDDVREWVDSATTKCV